MSDLSVHVHKLGHELEEIRVRALNNIVSKLECGLLSDELLIDQDELFKNLVQWFSFSCVPEKCKVLCLILRLVQTKNGAVQLLRCDPGLTKLSNIDGNDEKILVGNIAKVVMPEYFQPKKVVSGNNGVTVANCSSQKQIELPVKVPTKDATTSMTRPSGQKPTKEPQRVTLISTDKTVDQKKEKNPVNSGVDSSIQRSVQNFGSPVENSSQKSENILEFHSKLPPVNNPTSSNDVIPRSFSETNVIKSNCFNMSRPMDGLETDRTRGSCSSGALSKSETVRFNKNVATNMDESANYIESCFRVWTLPWQKLVKPDVHVLTAVENSLKNSSMIEHTCHFFTTVMLYDYPPEVFLQRQSIIKNILNLASSGSVPALNALNEFVKLLHNRLLFFLDPATSCLKVEVNSFSGDSSEASPPVGNNYRSLVNDAFYQYKEERNKADNQVFNDGVIVSVDQLAIPQFCAFAMQTIAPFCGKIECVSAPLFLKLVEVFEICLYNSFLFWTSQNASILCIRKQLYHTMVVFAEAISKSMSLEPVHRLLLICSTCSLLKYLIPVPLSSVCVPIELQKVLIDLLVDPSIILYYDELYSGLISYVKEFKKDADSDSIIVRDLYKSMKASMAFVQDYKNLSSEETINMFKLSLPSLVFHQKFEIIKCFIENCIEKFDGKDTEEASLIIVTLLAHVDCKVSLETYKIFHEKISTFFGPGQASRGYDPFPKLKFFINAFILREIICHGVTNEDEEVQSYSEEIIILILKCQMLVSEQSWLYIWAEIAPVLPLLQSFVDKDLPLGETVIDMFNPDVAKVIGMSESEVLLANIRFLLSVNEQCREEAAARLMWLTSTTIKIDNLSDICIVDKSITRKQKLSGIYEAESMIRVVEVLKCPDIDGKIVESALTQLSVMTDDPHLHNIFIDENGLEIIINLLHSFFGHECDERKVVLPIITSLKNLARHCSKIRLLLCQDLKTLKTLIKCLFIYHNKWRLQRDATQLLAFIVFAEFFITTPDSISLPQLIVTHFKLPFECVSHWNVSPYSQPTLKGNIINNRKVQSALSILWLAIESGDLLNVDKPPNYSNPDMSVKLQDLRHVQGSVVHHNCKLLLNVIKSAKSHKDVHNTLPVLTKFLEVSCFQPEIKGQFEENSLWKQTLIKFLSAYPLSKKDEQLLLSVLRFLRFVVATMTPQINWISDIITNPFKPMLKLLTSYTDENSKGLILWKELLMSLLQLSGDCCKLGNSSNICWNGLTVEIMRCLHHTHTQHFYNLAFLDTVLGCLSCILTAREGTTEELSCDVLWELLSAFHCGTPNSCMGLSIVRQTVILLNNLLHLDVKSKKSNKWEEDWIKENNILLLLSLCNCRDIVIRAGALQLISGLSSERHAALVVLDLLPTLWTTALSILLDHDEASIVREQAAAVCMHIICHNKHEEYLSAVLEKRLFFQLQTILSCLKVEKVVWNKYKFIFTDENDGEIVPTTPGLIKSVCRFVISLLSVYPGDINEVIKKEGLIMSLIRCFLKNSSEKVMSNEVYEMYCSICSLLYYCIDNLNSVNIPPDLIQVLIKFLDENSYGVNVSLKVRDKLWSKALLLLSTILYELSDEDHNIVIPDYAIKTICYCLDENTNQLLQQSTMSSLIGLCYFLNDDGSKQICEKLILLWDKWIITKRRKPLVEALTVLLGHSHVASQTALNMGLLQLLIYRLRNVLVTLAIETGDTSRLRKGNPILGELSLYLGLSCNFLSSSPEVKVAAANAGFADCLHKLWVWCLADYETFLVALQTLITFTANCPQGARSLLLTSTTAGVGQRKTPSSFSLVHALMNLITNNKEQYPTLIINRAFMLLTHSCQAPEARAIIAKSTLLNRFTELGHHKKLPTDDVEGVWLKFLMVFSYYPEGQLVISKGKDAVEQLIDLSASNRSNVSYAATSVLRNISFHSSNRPRLLTSENFLSHIGNKLNSSSNIKEKIAVAAIIWAMVANNQKAKLTIRSAGIDARLQLAAASVTSDNDAVELFDFIVSLIVPNRERKITA